MRKIMVIGVIGIIFYGLCASRYLDIYALAAEEQEKAAVNNVLVTANERLNVQIEELKKENEELKSSNMTVQGESANIKRDRTQILEKLKLITEENNKMREQIVYLEKGIVNLDYAKRNLKDDEKSKRDKISELENELRSLREVKKDFDIYQSSFIKLQAKIMDAFGEEIKNLDDAVDVIGKSKDNFSEETEALQDNLKNALSELSDSTENLSRLKKEVADMHYNMGVIFQEDNKWDEAAMEYKKVLESDPKDADAHYNLALIYDTAKNDRKQALYHYRKYIELKPEADDILKVKEYLADLGMKDKIWGDPYIKEITENTNNKR